MLDDFPVNNGTHVGWLHQKTKSTIVQKLCQALWLKYVDIIDRIKTWV